MINDINWWDLELAIPKTKPDLEHTFLRQKLPCQSGPLEGNHMEPPTNRQVPLSHPSTDDVVFVRWLVWRPLSSVTAREQMFHVNSPNLLLCRNQLAKTNFRQSSRDPIFPRYFWYMENYYHSSWTCALHLGSTFASANQTPVILHIWHLSWVFAKSVAYLASKPRSHAALVSTSCRFHLPTCARLMFSTLSSSSDWPDIWLERPDQERQRKWWYGIVIVQYEAGTQVFTSENGWEMLGA